MTTYLQNINEVVSTKIALVEYDVPLQVLEFSNFEAGIWVKKMTPGVVTIAGSDGLTGYYEDQATWDYKNIGSLKVDTDDFIKVSTMADLRLQNMSFLYDQATTETFFHFDGFDWPLNKIILLGVVNGFCSQANTVNGCYYNDIFYEPRLKTIPSISKKKDPMFFGLLQFQSFNLQFINNDGYFDTFRTLNIFRQPARVLFGFDGNAYSEFVQVAAGYVENYTRTAETFTLRVQDIRKGLTRSIPTRVFTKLEYPYLDDNSVDKIKPLAYGAIRNAPVVCTNATATTPVNYTFLIMDTTDHAVLSVQNVYVDRVLLAPAKWSIAVATGILSITAANVVDNLTDVTVDFTANTVTNSLDVAKDILYIYADYAFIASNYNVTDWNIATAAARNVGLYLGKEDAINKWLEKLFDASDAIFYCQDDGKFSARVYDSTKTPVKTIQTYEWMDDYAVSVDDASFLSSVKISYYPDEKKPENSRTYINKDYEHEVLGRYKAYQQKEFKTILATEAEAIDKSEVLMLLGKEISDIVVRKVKMQHTDLELMDLVIASPATRYTDADDWGVWEVIGIQKDMNNFDIQLTLKWVSDYTPSATGIYTQGYLYYTHLWQDKLWSVTSI